MKNYNEFITNQLTEGAITASDAKTAEAHKLANALKPLIKMGSPLESQLTKLSDQARDLKHKELGNAVDALRKVLSPTFQVLSRFTKV